MKLSKSQLRKIIREEKSNLLNESRYGNVGLGFQGWSANKTPDFAKAYGKDARVIRDFGSNEFQKNRVKESMHQHEQEPLKQLAEDSIASMMPILDLWEQETFADRVDPRADDVYDLLFQLQERLMAILENRD
tara:strand:+ start:209 stop:607 length:399 start_codon:yes stop_codon:yes gene_type:complete